MTGLGGDSREAASPEAGTLCAGWERGPVEPGVDGGGDAGAVCSGHDLGVMWLQFARYPLCAFTNVGAHVYD